MKGSATFSFILFFILLNDLKLRAVAGGCGEFSGGFAAASSGTDKLSGCRNGTSGGSGEVTGGIDNTSGAQDELSGGRILMTGRLSISSSIK